MVPIKQGLLKFSGVIFRCRKVNFYSPNSSHDNSSFSFDLLFVQVHSVSLRSTLQWEHLHLYYDVSVVFLAPRALSNSSCMVLKLTRTHMP